MSSNLQTVHSFFMPSKSLSLVKWFAVFAFLSGASSAWATSSLGQIDPPQNLPFSGSVFGDDAQSVFQFDLLEQSVAAVSVTNIFFSFSGIQFNEIASFAASLNMMGGSGSPQNLSYSAANVPNLGLSSTAQLLSFAGVLLPGTYQLVIAGDAPVSGASFGGNMAFAALGNNLPNVGQVPIPMAFGMFGCALASVIALGRRFGGSSTNILNYA